MSEENGTQDSMDEKAPGAGQGAATTSQEVAAAPAPTADASSSSPESSTASATAEPDGDKADADEAEFFAGGPKASAASPATPAAATSPRSPSQAQGADTPSSFADSMKAGFHMDVEEAMEGLEPPEEESGGRRVRSVLISIFMMAFAAFLLFGMRGEAVYWFTASGDAQSIEAKDVAKPGALDPMAGRLIRMKGSPAGTAARFKKRFQMKELVVLKGTSVMLERPATNGAVTDEDAKKRPPDMAPVDVEGRLVKVDELPGDYSVAVKSFLAKKELAPADGHHYVLMQDERPRSGWQVPAMVFALLALFFLNLRHLLKSLKGL